ncbi:MAG: hypothetical protein ACXW10_09825 [Acidimicrobiia bacterium]
MPSSIIGFPGAQLDVDSVDRTLPVDRRSLGTVVRVSNSNMIWWIVVGWLPAVLVWSFGDDGFTTIGGVAWLGFMYWAFWRRSTRR